MWPRSHAARFWITQFISRLNNTSVLLSARRVNDDPIKTRERVFLTWNIELDLNSSSFPACHARCVPDSRGIPGIDSRMLGVKMLKLMLCAVNLRRWFYNPKISLVLEKDEFNTNTKVRFLLELCITLLALVRLTSVVLHSFNRHSERHLIPLLFTFSGLFISLSSRLNFITITGTKQRGRNHDPASFILFYFCPLPQFRVSQRRPLTHSPCCYDTDFCKSWKKWSWKHVYVCTKVKRHR